MFKRQRVRRGARPHIEVLLTILWIGVAARTASADEAPPRIIPDAGVQTEKPDAPDPLDGADAALRLQIAELIAKLDAQQRQIDDQAAEYQELRQQVEGVGTDVQSQAPVDACPACRHDDCHGESCSTPGCNGGASNPSPLVEIGGQYRLMGDASNFDFDALSISDDQPSETFFNQRFRTWLTVRPNDQVTGFLEVEMGHIGWGSNYDFPKTYAGPRFPASIDPNGDRVGIELRRGYLEYQNESEGALRAGIQGWQDSFSQTLASADWDFNVGGLNAVQQTDNARLQFGLFQLVEGDIQAADDSLLLTNDFDWQLSDEEFVGVSAYYVNDRGDYSYPVDVPYDSSWDVWLGTRAKVVLFGGLPANAFVIFNLGERDDVGAAPNFEHDGVACKFEVGGIPVGPGQWFAQGLYSYAGFRTIAQSVRDDFGAQGYWSYLSITSPFGPSDVNDLGVSLQNRGLGLATVQSKYEYPILPKLTGYFATGWLRSVSANPVNGSTEMGTEIVKMFTYHFGGGLHADIGTAALFTGDFYKPAPGSPAPSTLYHVFSRVQLEF